MKRNKKQFCSTPFRRFGLNELTNIYFFQYQTSPCGAPRQHGSEAERNYYESLYIVLETLERCLSSQPKDITKFEETMNVKLLLREICQFIGNPRKHPTNPLVNQLSNPILVYFSDMPNENAHAIKLLASKVLFALSLNFFNAVFNRISARLQELSACSEENPDYSDIELIQHINVDVNKLSRLFSEAIQKFRLLKKSAHLVLMNSLEKAIWNWMDTYPQVTNVVRRPSRSWSY